MDLFFLFFFGSQVFVHCERGWGRTHPQLVENCINNKNSSRQHQQPAGLLPACFDMKRNSAWTESCTASKMQVNIVIIIKVILILVFGQGLTSKHPAPLSNISEHLSEESNAIHKHQQVQYKVYENQKLIQGNKKLYPTKKRSASCLDIMVTI